jgi:predicted transcriptional regulator
MKKTILSEFVRIHRRSADLTQVQLAQKAGLSLSFIRNLEQGKASLRTDTVNKVLFLFGKCLGPVDLPRD